MNDSTKTPGGNQESGDKPSASPSTVINRPDNSSPDTIDRPRAQPDRIVQPGNTQSGKEDNALESLGKAVSAPVLGAANEDPDAPTER